MIKLSRPLIVFDLETTGPNPERDRIVSFGFQRFVGEFPEGIERTWKSLIRSDISIPPEASFGVGGKYKGHGITDALVNSCRTCGRNENDSLHSESGPAGSTWHPFTPFPTFTQIAPNIVKGFTDVDFGGFNIRFDLQVVRTELGRAGIEWDHGDARVLDGFRLWQIAIPRTLSDAVKEFCNREATDAHEAGADVADAVDVICGILRKFGTLPRDLEELNRLCFPGKIDADGKFAFDESGTPIVNFGKQWKGVAMSKVDKGYYRWMLAPKQNFAPSTKAVVREALNGRFPVQANAGENDEEARS